MDIIHLKGAEKYEPEKGWLRASVCCQNNVSVEYFIKPGKHSSPLHDHPQEQVCVVIKGRMMVRSGDGMEAMLEPGDAAHFAPNEPHAVANAIDEESIGVDIFVPGRSFDFWTKRIEKKA